MGIFELSAILLVLAATFSYLNYRLLGLPPAIGLMALTLIASLGLIAAGYFIPGLDQQAETAVKSIDLNEAFLHGMLGFLLFAGALHVDMAMLRKRLGAITMLATVGVITSTILVGLMTYFLLAILNIEIRPIYCFLFGALISPTDPIAVMGLLRQANVPKELEIKIAGESLFNDGVGVVIFLAVLEVATGDANFNLVHFGELFIWEALGGAILGIIGGTAVVYLLKSVDNYQVEVMLSLALVAGGYALADHLHMSGPIAMVMAGLMIGNWGRAIAMSETTIKHLDMFWELIDEILNAVLFVVIGLEVLVIDFENNLILAGAIAILMVLLARFIAVAIPITFARRWGNFPTGTIRVLTWGGLRGGISVALALSLPTDDPDREIVIVMTYIVVVFSILVQGLTIGPLARIWIKPEASEPVTM